MNILENILKMTNLEELMIYFHKADTDSLDHFVNELTISFPKMRSVRLVRNGKYLCRFSLCFFEQHSYVIKHNFDGNIWDHEK